VSDDERMVRDVFPAEVVFTDGTVLTGVRVFVTTERCMIWALDDKKELVNVHALYNTTTDAKPSRNTLQEGERVAIDVDNLQRLVVNKGRGCGCGSKLKALSPPINWTRG
jgi:hypothetical protein